MDKPKALICYNDSIWHKGSNKSVFWAQKLREDGFDVERVNSTLPLCDRKLLDEVDLLILSWSEEHIIEEQALNLADAIGIPEDMLRQAAKSAVCKINIDSDLRLAMTAGVRQVLMQKPEAFDPREYLKAGRQNVKELVAHNIVNVLGSYGKAFE